MILLGINSVYHDSSAALLENGKILAVAEEERFSRIKHAKPALVSNPQELPTQAIRYCLRQAGLKVGDVEGFCYSFDPQRRRRTFRLDPNSQKGDWGDRDGEATFLASLKKVPGKLSEALGEDVSEKFHWVPHHMAHAASAFYPSGYEEAAVLIIDGIGESAGGMLMRGRGTELLTLEEIEHPHSLGFLWEKLSKYLGFSEYDACKVMGLASYGNGHRVDEAFSKIARITPDGFEIDGDIAAFRTPDFATLHDILGPERHRSDPLTNDHYAIASALQTYTDKAVLNIAKAARRRCPSRNLCYAGGVALNCVANWLLKEESGFENVFIPSAPNDSGTAIGAALYVYYSENDDAAATTAQLNPYLGPSYSSNDIESALAQSGLRYRRDDDVAAEAARRVADGQVVGWFQGGMEFGPRALGNRSLLADPRTAETRERINHKVKHREAFRPFGPSVLAEKADEWFQIGQESDCYKYMLIACPVRDDKRDEIPAVVHVDGTSRIQTVHQDLSPKYHRLISLFERETGVPLVLNTSFNDSEPIVCSPENALATFSKTKIDSLIIGDFVVERDLLHPGE